ncbi:hypothetical protein N7I30_11405 [Aurantimonas litoralis]|nr:hypothetical protein [Aurantimonas litoralis]
MRSPMQSAPVMRGATFVTDSGGVGQSFSWSCLLKCGSKLIRCAPQCIPNPLNPGCISCLGSSFNTCKNCF